MLQIAAQVKILAKCEILGLISGYVELNHWMEDCATYVEPDNPGSELWFRNSKQRRGRRRNSKWRYNGCES